MFRSLGSGKEKKTNPFDKDCFLRDDIWERTAVLEKILKARDPYNDFFSIDSLEEEFMNQSSYSGIASRLNHDVNKIQIKSEIEEKYLGLYRVLSKLKSYVKNPPSVLESMSLYSGYSNKEILDLLSVGNLVIMVKVGGTSEWGQFFGAGDNKKIHISEDLVSSLDKGGFDYTKFKIVENLNGRSFLVGVTVLHELVHYGRYWNGLPRLVGKYEAGQMFEKRVFGLVNGISGSTQNATIYDWEF
jgi:hypothetical protein